MALAVRAHLGSSISSDISSIFGAVLALSVLRCCRFTSTSSLVLVFVSAVALTFNTISIRIGSNVNVIPCWCALVIVGINIRLVLLVLVVRARVKSSISSGIGNSIRARTSFYLFCGAVESHRRLH